MGCSDKERKNVDRKKVHVFQDIGKCWKETFPSFSNVIEQQTRKFRVCNCEEAASDNGRILVRQRVVVNLDGSGNFTTIHDVVAAAPINTRTSNGYFVIHVVARVYAEYVSIAKNKQNFMMIGDNINQTVIIGNHNVVDGWTTFNSSIFGKLNCNFKLCSL